MSTNDPIFNQQHARDRAETAIGRAALHRLQVADGRDITSRVVAAIGLAADALRSAGVHRRDRAAVERVCVTAEGDLVTVS